MEARDLGYKLTTLQQAVLDLTNTFDSDSEVRYNLLSYSHTRDHWRLTREEVAALPLQLKLHGSAVWLREAVRGYLIYLEYLVGLIRGEEQRILIFPEDFVTSVQAEKLRSNWLRLPDFAQAVHALIEMLRESLDYFNVQLVEGWVMRVLMRRWDDERPSFWADLPQEQVLHELRNLEDVVYSRARVIYGSEGSRFFEAMTRVPGIEEKVRRFFILSHKQLMIISSYLQGNSNVTADDIVAIDPPVPRAQSRWMQTRSGIVLPRPSM